MAPATAVQSNQHFFLAPPNKKLNINIKAIKTHDFSILKVLTLGEGDKDILRRILTLRINAMTCFAIRPVVTIKTATLST